MTTSVTSVVWRQPRRPAGAHRPEPQLPRGRRRRWLAAQPPPHQPPVPLLPATATVLDRAEYAVLRQELAELKAESMALRGGARAGKVGAAEKRLAGHWTAAGPCPTTLCVHVPCPAALQLESALVQAARDEAAAREAGLRGELERAQAAASEQAERAARARRLHER